MNTWIIQEIPRGDIGYFEVVKRLPNQTHISIGVYKSKGMGEVLSTLSIKFEPGDLIRFDGCANSHVFWVGRSGAKA